MPILKFLPQSNFLSVTNSTNIKKMMKQNMLKSSTTFSIFLLIILTTPLACALKPSPSNSKTEIEIHKLETRDAITLSIQEVRETRKFISSIPRLKSLRLTQQDPMLLLCVELLIFDLSDMKSTLYRLRHLKPMFLPSDTNSLKRMTGRSVSLGKMCSKSLKSVDKIVLLMLTRKLDDLSMVIDDVVYHVSEIEREEYHGDQTVEKP